LLRSGQVPKDPSDGIVAASLTDIIAKSLAELNSLEIVDLRSATDQSIQPATADGADALAIETEFLRTESGATWRAVISEIVGRRILWSTIASVSGTRPPDVDHPRLLGASNQVVDAVMSRILSASSDQQNRLFATVLCQQGIQQLLKLGKENVEDA